MRVLFTLLVAILFAFCFQSINAQNIQISMSPHPSPYLSDWEAHTETLVLIVNNTSGRSVDVKISTQLYNGNSDIIAQTDLQKMPVLSIPEGVSSYHAEDIYPVSDIKYDNSYKAKVIKTGRLPDDNYRLCVLLVDPKTGVPLTVQQPQCKMFTITAYQAPILMSPKDKDTVNTKQLQGFLFKWTPVVPRPVDVVSYHLQIWEILPGQDAMRAFLGNKPIVEKDITNMTQAVWPTDFELPRTGMGYVWSVQALDAQGRPLVDNGGRAEPFSFWVKDGSNVQPYSGISIELHSPLGKQDAKIERPDFTWTTTGGDGVTYNLTLTRNWIAGDTDSNVAFVLGDDGKKQKVIFVEKGIVGNTFKYPDKQPALVKSKNYSWFVTAVDSKGNTVGQSRQGSFTDSASPMTPSFCTDFENGTYGGWTPNNIDENIQPTGGNPGKYVETTDEQGASYFYNESSDYTGNWGNLMANGCGSLCFDIKYNYNGNPFGTIPPPLTMQPSITLYSNGLSASFVTWNLISVGDGWHSYCAPLKGLNASGTLPSNSDGHWVMGAGTTPSDWATILSNVTRVSLPCDPNNYQNERIGYDNICIKNTGDCTPPPSGGPCDSLHANAVKNTTGNCCWKINLTHPNNTAGIKGIQFLALSPNSFSSPSLSSSSGWLTSVSNAQEFRIKHLSGYVTPGQLNGFFKFCMNTLSSQSKIVVNWLNDSNTVICSDTVSVYCAIPCATFTKDTVTCNGTNYNIKYAFTNNANFSVSNIRYTVLSPAGVSVIPGVTNLSGPVTNGHNSGDISLALTGVGQNTKVCILVRFRSPDSCCWCYDTLCITTPPCICNNISASVSGNIYNCCYNLSLTNNYAANYFTEVKLTCISSGVTFSTFTFSGNWGAMGVFPSNVAEVANGTGYIPSGLSSNIGSLCFTGYTTTPQYIQVQWIRNDTVVCIDTIQTNCVPPSPPHNNCAQIVNDKLICLPNGTYQYTFQIQNNDPTNTTTGFQLNPVLPGGLVLTPYIFTASIPPHTVSVPQTLIITGIGQNTHFCFEIALFQHVGNLYSWCCHGDTVCFTSPACGGCCPGTWGSISYAIQNAAGFSHTALSCGKEYAISCSLPYPITAIYTCNINDPTCSGNVTYKVLPNTTGASITSAGVFTATTSGNCSVVIYGWCGTHLCDSCSIYFVVTCASSSCCPGNWGDIFYTIQYPGTSMNTPLSCGKEYPVTCSQAYPVTAHYICNSGIASCSGSVTYKVFQSSSASVTSSGIFTATTSGTYNVTIYGWCGTHLCDSCIISFVVSCNPVCCPGTWGSLYYSTQNAAGTTTSDLVCSHEYPATCSQPYSIHASYSCSNISSSCTGKVTYKVLQTSGATISATGVFTATLSGTYDVVIYGWCGTHLCDSCMISFVVNCKTSCCIGKWASHYYTTQNAAGSSNTTLTCGKYYDLACSQPITIMAVYGCPTNGNCPQSATYKVSPSAGATITSAGVFTATTTGTYTVTMYGWCGGGICDSCQVYFVVTCKSCCPGKWGSLSYSYSLMKANLTEKMASTNVVTVPMACQKIYTLTCSQVYTVSASYTCGVDQSCTGFVTYKVSPAGATITPAGVFTATATGSYLVTIYGHCGVGICDSCQVNFRVTCPNTNPCVITNWTTESIIYSNASAKGSIKPGSKITLPAGKAYTFESPAYHYATASPCLPSYSWAVDGIRMGDGKTTTLSFTKGSHTVIITPGCKGDNCKQIQFIVNAK